MRAMAKGAPAKCPAYVPHSASCRRVARSRIAMKRQGCVFFELCTRLPAFKIVRIASSERGSAVNWRTARLVRITSETVMRVYLLSWVQAMIKAEAHSAISNRPSHCLKLTHFAFQGRDLFDRS